MADENIKRRGRPKKVKLSDDELFEEILLKAYDIAEDENGKVVFKRNGTVLTLEETAFLIWNIEGRKTKQPLTKMAMVKTEQNALRKMREGLAKFGIKSFDDVFESKTRTFATAKFGCTDSPE